MILRYAYNPEILYLNWEQYLLIDQIIVRLLIPTQGIQWRKDMRQYNSSLIVHILLVNVLMVFHSVSHSLRSDINRRSLC